MQTPAEILENFGFSIDPASHENGPGEGYYDVVISIGHSVPDPGELPPRRHHVHYSLYPLSDTGLPKRVDRMIAISSFSSEGVRRVYHRNAEVIYPCVPTPQVDLTDKRNRIVTVGRAGSNKSLDILAEAFLEMDLPEDTELHIVIPEDDFDPDALEIKRMARNERVVLHTALTMSELSELYASAAVLWAARGYGRPLEMPEINFEHFGYTPVEALRHYCLPIAYDAGGYTETTLLRWETLGELEAITKRVLEDKSEWAAALEKNFDVAGPFSEEHFATQWLRVVLQMNTYVWEQHVEWRVGDASTAVVVDSGIHVAVIGDHPALGTGYGVVCKQITEGILAAGMQPHVLGINGSVPNFSKDYEIWPSPHGLEVNRAVLPSFIASRNFDAAVIMYDPFISSRLINAVRGNAGYLPIVSLVSQEGRPAHVAWENILAKSRACITYSQSAASAIESAYGREKRVEWAHLGVDHESFERYDDRTRKAMRAMLGWDDLFIIYAVSANKRNKAIWKQMQTTMILHNDYGHSDVKLVLHTNPTPDLKFQGIDVDMYSAQIRVNPKDSLERGVIVAPTPRGGLAPYDCDLEDLFRQGMPGSVSDKHAWYSQLGMIARYNLADLYLDMSSVEGFNLPLFEAMACGLPAITINDNFVRREIIGDHPSLLAAYPLDVWNTGAEMMLASPVDAAARIDSFRYGDKDAAIMGVEAQKIVDSLRWESAQGKVVKAIQECLM
jgi:glycosyltransferase involved in cell wall biosynthesis